MLLELLLLLCSCLYVAMYLLVVALPLQAGKLCELSMNLYAFD